MADQLTSTGLFIDSYEDRLAALKAALRAAIAANLDLSSDQPTGQFVEAFAEHAQSLAELLQEIYTAFDPDEASGTSLTSLGLITGTQRRAATNGTVDVTLTLDATTTVPAGTVFAVLGDSTNTWVLDDPVTSVGAGWYAGTCTAGEAGAIQALSGTITVIVTPVAGLTAVVNVQDATMGQDEETDTELRLRRELEVTLGGSASVDSVAAELINLTGMIAVNVVENDTWHGGSMPPHSIEPVIWDGVAPAVDDADIAEVIFEQKPAGIQSYGTETETHTDDQGNDHTIEFTRATQIEIEMNYTLTTDTDAYPGDSALEAALAAWDDDNITIGEDMIYSRWLSLPFELVDGIVDVDDFEWRKSGEPAFYKTNITIAAREIATVGSGDITIV